MMCAMSQIFNGVHKYPDMTVTIDTKEGFVNILADDSSLDAHLEGAMAEKFAKQLVFSALRNRLSAKDLLHFYITNYFNTDFSLNA